MSVDSSIAYLDGDAALPRKNGELVFEAPWEGRAFGLAVVLSEKGEYEWDDFHGQLVAAIAGGERRYYESWLDALQSLLLSRGVISPDELARRTEEYVSLERDPVF